MIMALIYRNVPRKKTNELLLLGERIDADEARAARDRQPGRAGRRVRRRGGRLGGAAGEQVAGADAAGQGRDVPPAGPGVRRRARASCAHSLTLAFSTEDIQEGVTRVLREAGAGVEGPLSRPSSRCSAAPRTARAAGARRRAGACAEAIAERLGVERAARRLARRAARRRAGTEDLRDSRGCLLEAGGQLDDALDGGRFPVLCAGDCSICVTTLPALARRPARRVRAVARRPRRLQHARHDAVAVPRRHVPGRRVRRLGHAASTARRSIPRASSCAACATSTPASACCSTRTASR